MLLTLVLWYLTMGMAFGALFVYALKSPLFAPRLSSELIENVEHYGLFAITILVVLGWLPSLLMAIIASPRR